MAEQAVSAVSSLLSIIRSEARLLGGVRDDVRYIKEEMESMAGFLEYLARTAPPGGKHDELVSTWMHQVRLLAQDCRDCVDIYRYRRDPEIHRARGGLWHYFWWLAWFPQKMVAQHHAAIQLSELKDRAREVSDRRLRYGATMVPREGALPAASPSASGGYAGRDDEDDDDGGGDQQQALTTTTDHSGRRRSGFFEPRTDLDDYFQQKLREWIEKVTTYIYDNTTSCIAIVVSPDTEKDALALAHETLVAPGIYYHRSIFVDVPAVHLKESPLRPKETLYYILRELKQDTRDLGSAHPELFDDFYKRLYIKYEKKMMFREIKTSIAEMKVDQKLEKIEKDIQDRLRRLKTKGMVDQLPPLVDLKHLELVVLFPLLFHSAAAAAQAQQGLFARNKAMHKLATAYDSIITETAKKLKGLMDVEEPAAAAKLKVSICLDDDQYESILRDVFLKTTTSKPLQAKEDTKATAKTLGEDQIKQLIHEAKQEILRELQEGKSGINKQATKTTAKTLGEDQIKQMILEAKQEILWELQKGKSDKNQQATGEPGGQGQIPEYEGEILQELQEGNSDKNQATNGLGGQGQIPEYDVEEIVHKIESVKEELKKQLKIQGIVNRIKYHLKGETPLIILKIDDQMMDGTRWMETRNALNLLKCGADALVITTTKNTQQAKEYCHPCQEPIYYTLTGLYHDTVLKLTSQQKDGDYKKSRVLWDILDECEPYEFCMKIFAHALYAKPKRSNDELRKLHTTLKVSPKSLDHVAKEMFKFSYNDLTKEHRSCLLYLAIFPQGHKIRRSTLIGRWVVEGLITKEDWPTSVHQAERCFDMLIDRWLVYPGDTSPSGKVKSCMVSNLVHGFITKIARKQHIVETRLSHHLAHHFSIFNDIELRGSDRIETFLQRISNSSKWSMLKVLDLENCHCFKKTNYLTEICSKIVLLKYLSIRGTDVTQLPNEINNLHELEVLDIQQTMLNASATKHLMLLKLKRLLSGNIHSSVQVPYKIGKMVNMEVLSKVKASLNGRELLDIGKLWKLQKLSVAIEDKDSHLRNLLRAISDLHECLLSLSITFPVTRCEGTPSDRELPAIYYLKYIPKLLESLSIRGTTEKMQLLPLLVRDHHHQLSKVTLSSTSLNQKDLKVLAKLTMLLCLKLENIDCTESMLTFKKNEFQNLKYFLLQGSSLTEIMFEEGATPELKKIILSSTNIGCVSGVQGLIKLEELELNNNRSGRLFSSFDNGEQITKLTLRGTFLEQADLHILAKKPNLRCLVLLDKSYDGFQLTFNKDEFPKLNILIVDCSDITNINFTRGSAVKLEKIIWTFANMKSLYGTNNLQKLKEVEFNGGLIPSKVEEAINELTKRPGFDFRHNKPENQEQAKGEATEDDDARFSFCW